MNILVTGSKGFIGNNLVNKLKKNADYCIYEFSRKDSLFDLEKIIHKIDIVFHLAGINKKNNDEDFNKGNILLTKKLCEILKKNSKTIIYFASSIHSDKNTEYGKSKKEGEEIFLELEKKHGNKVYILKLPRIFGMGCKPNYNSVVATFCNNVVNKIDLNIIEPKNQIELVFIDDLCKQLANLINKNTNKNNYIEIEKIYKISIEELAIVIKNFNTNSCVESYRGLEKKLYKTFLSYK